MEFNFAQTQAKRNGRNVILQMLVLALAAAAFILFFGPSITNVYGSYAKFYSALDLPEMYDDGERYVTAQAEVLFDSDYVLSEDGKDKYYYFVFWAEHQYVVCRTPLSFTEYEYYDYTVQGKLVQPDSDHRTLLSRITGDIAEGMEVSRTEAEDYIADYVINITNTPRLMDQILYGVAMGLILLAVVRIILAARTMADYTNAKSYKKLAGGNSEEAARMNEGISREIAEDRVLYQNGNLVVTANWVGEKLSNKFRICPKADVVWIYRTVTQHRTNGIPSGKTHTLNLCLTDRTSFTVNARNEKKAVELQNQLEGCGFQAVFGYSPDIQGLYNGDMTRFINLARQQGEFAPRPPEAEAPPAESGGSGQPRTLEEEQEALRQAAADATANNTPPQGPDLG